MVPCISSTATGLLTAYFLGIQALRIPDATVTKSEQEREYGNRTTIQGPLSVGVYGRKVV